MTLSYWERLGVQPKIRGVERLCRITRKLDETRRAEKKDEASDHWGQFVLSDSFVFLKPHVLVFQMKNLKETSPKCLWKQRLYILLLLSFYLSCYHLTLFQIWFFADLQRPHNCHVWWLAFSPHLRFFCRIWLSWPPLSSSDSSP